MKIYMRSNRNGGISYTSYDGMTVETVTGLMTDLGHTDIEEITEQDFLENMPQA